MDFQSIIEQVDKLKLLRGFSPERFAIIESLSLRLAGALHQDNTVLMEKIRIRLDEYQADYQAAHEHASETLHTIKTDFPAYQQEAESLFVANQFACLHRYYENLEQGREKDVLFNELKACWQG